MTAQPLASDVATARVAVDLLAQAGIGPDDPDFAELVASETDVLDRIRRILRAARHIEADTAALDGMIADMRERKDRLGERARRLRAAAAWALSELGMKRLDAPDMTVTLAPGKPPLVGAVDAENLPERFLRLKREADRVALRAALEAGETVEGVWLGNPQPTLRISTK